MHRIAFKMKLKPGFVKEYERRHNLIWPELKLLLEEAGVYDYSIFFDDETNSLFAVQKIKTTTGSQDLAHQEVVQRWWKYMADIMIVNPDNSPVSISLKEVFRME